MKKSDSDFKVIQNVDENYPSLDLPHPGNKITISGKGKCLITAIDGITVYYKACATGVRGSILNFMISSPKKESTTPKKSKVKKHSH